MRVVGTHACTQGVCLIHHESWKTLRSIQGYLVSPSWCSDLPYDDGILPQWFVFAVTAQAGLEEKWDIEVLILVKIKIICSVRHNIEFIFFNIVCEFLLRWKEDKKKRSEILFLASQDDSRRNANKYSYLCLHGQITEPEAIHSLTV